MPDNDLDGLAFEKDKWRDELRLRERELVLRESEAKKSNWRSPLVVAISAAALAAFGNAFITWIDGTLARQLEERRSIVQFQLEANRADSERILQVIESDDPAAVRNNLEFLLEAGLVADTDLRVKLAEYLRATPDSRIPRLPQSRDEIVGSKRALRILSIGVSGYEHVAELANPGFDARLIAAAAESQRGGIYGEVTAKVALDIRKPELISLFEELSRDVEPDRGDVAIIYFAGHAAQISGELFLLPLDADAKDEQTLRQTSFSVNEMAVLLEPLARTSHVFLAIDACPGEEFGSPAAALGSRNITVVLASTPGTVCFDGVENAFSPFAQAMAEGFSAKADKDGDKVISVSELVQFIRTRTSELTDKQQVPFASLGFDGILLDGSFEDLATTSKPVVEEPEANPSGGLTIVTDPTE